MFCSVPFLVKYALTISVKYVKVVNRHIYNSQSIKIQLNNVENQIKKKEFYLIIS